MLYTMPSVTAGDLSLLRQLLDYLGEGYLCQKEESQWLGFPAKTRKGGIFFQGIHAYHRSSRGRGLALHDFETIDTVVLFSSPFETVYQRRLNRCYLLSRMVTLEEAVDLRYIRDTALDPTARVVLQEALDAFRKDRLALPLLKPTPTPWD